jgi:hypothetical protein
MLESGRFWKAFASERDEYLFVDTALQSIGGEVEKHTGCGVLC